MKPLSLEGLRRLVRGNRDKTAQTEDSHHFRRSNSFKRASLRKSVARRHEKITLPNGLVVKTSALQRKVSVSSDERPADDGYSTDGDTTTGGGGGSGGGGDVDVDVGGRNSSSSATRRVITYDEWVAAASDDESTPKRTPQTDESCPSSTLSTNKLSSLDSGHVRHSLESKKRFSMDSNSCVKIVYSHHHHENTKVVIDECSDRVDIVPARETPTRRSLESNFRRSISTTESPVPSLRFKNILGSPRVAPKTREPSPSGASGCVSYSVHNTPNRSRILGVGSQPVSAPPTPGKHHLQRLHHQSSVLSPVQHLRSSLHERERFCAVHGTLPDSPQLHDKRPAIHPVSQVAVVNSPKANSRWSSMFSNSIFSRSPNKKKQFTTESIKHPHITQQLHQVHPQSPQQQKFYTHGSPASIHQRNVYSCSGSPAVARHLSVQSINGSPGLARTYAVNTSTVVGQTSLGNNFGVARAIGGIKNCEDYSGSPRGLSTPTHFSSPFNLKRQLSQPATSTVSPVLIQRQQSSPYPGKPSPAIQHRSVGSPILSQTHIQPSTKAFQVLGENPGVVNSSQFYPGKLGKGLVAALPPISVVGGRAASADRLSSRKNSEEKTVQSRTYSAERPKTPTPSSKFSVSPWGRPLSLSFNCAAKNDLMSPCSMTSEVSSKGDKRKKGPSLLVSRTSWFSRNSSRKSISSTKKAGFRKRMSRTWLPKCHTEEEMVPPPPPLPARFLSPEIFSFLNKNTSNTAQTTDSIIFVPPQRRNPIVRPPLEDGMLTPPTFAKKSNSHFRTAHVNLLMPLNQPVGSAHQVDGRNQKTADLIRSILEEADLTEEEVEDKIRDTSSEPGGAKFSVAPHPKPTSAPNTTRLSVKTTKNPEAILKVLGIATKRGWKRDGVKDLRSPNALKERAVTEVILKQLLIEEKNTMSISTGTMTSSAISTSGERSNTASLGQSVESLISLVESVVSSQGSSGHNGGGFRENQKVKRRKSQKKAPSLATHSFWRRHGKSKSTRNTTGLY